jgi:hypothetical protein
MSSITARTRMLSCSLLAGLVLLALILPAAAAASPGAGLPYAGLFSNRASTSGCNKAKDKIASAKRKLRKLKKEGASAQRIAAAKKQIKKAKHAAVIACGDIPTLYDITGLNASFDATIVPDPTSGCTSRKDVHWTASLGPNAKPASQLFLYTDHQGRPVYKFSADNIPYVAKGTGVATETCDQPPPASSGTTTCTFNLEQNLGASVFSDPETAADPVTLEWVFGFNVFTYASPQFGGSCTSSGSNPPDLSSEDSPGLFVSSINNESDGILEPVGVSHTPASSFDASPSLSISGAGSASFGGSLDESWQMAVDLRRR